MPEQTPEGGAGTAPAEERAKTFTQEDVDRIVTERLRRERQRTEKAVRDEFEQQIAELEATQEEGRQARSDAATLAGELRATEKRALIAERLLASGSMLPAPYLAQVDGEDEASIEAAGEQWAADVRHFGRPATDVGSPSNPAVATAPATPPVDADFAERMRQGDPEAFREYRSMRR